ncbi:MAG: DNA-protecting protein DprA [Actinobacteria bacterium]|nr:MAG: DNA-protecting protein DprA [Actinomycetota bacterium]
MTGGQPCSACLGRSRTLARLSPYLDRAGRGADRLVALLGLSDSRLAQLAGREADGGDPGAELGRCRRAGLTAICRHQDLYPARLRGLDAAPAVLYCTAPGGRLGDALAGPTMAIVGTRSASALGLETARALGRGLSAAGVTVISGMALGIDAAAHAGALEAPGHTVAVLAGGAERAHPVVHLGLYRRIAERSCVVSEALAGEAPRRWRFVARNRLIAGLADAVIVVEAPPRSGALLTARWARELGRPLGAVPGPVSAPRAAGVNALVRSGAELIRDAEDALELVCGIGGRRVPSPEAPAELPGLLGRLLAAVAEGAATPSELVESGIAPDEVLAGLAELELRGAVRRTLSGTYLPAL